MKLYFYKINLQSIICKSVSLYCVVLFVLMKVFNFRNKDIAQASWVESAVWCNGFDDQERNLTFVKTDLQVLKLKFHACNS